MRKLILIGFVGLLMAGACTSKKGNPVASSVPATSSSPAATAFQLEQTVLAAIRDAGSFHLVSVSKHGKQTATFIQDVGSTQGTQDITIGAQHTVIRVVRGVAYVRANRPALINFLGFPARVADRLHDRWVSFTPADAPFSDIAAAVTLDSAITDFALTGAITKTSTTTILGQTVFGLTGKGSGGETETVYVRANGPPLPVQTRGTFKTDTQVVTFSRWGERVTVAVPRNAIAFASVVGSSGGSSA